ncbi:MAG: DUF2971 domain-containing protein [Terracidiphilus sp.]
MNALDRFIREKPSGCLYHYTGAAGLIGIVRSGKLWATDYRHLNDRKEYQIGAKLLQDELRGSPLSEKQRNAFERLVSDTQRGCFVLSFSERGDQLSQWRAYCPSGNGYALGFGQQNALFSSAKQHSFNLVRCEYDHREQQKLCQYLVESFMEGMASRQNSLGQASTVESRVRTFFQRYQWNLALALVMSALKHSGFEEEREWRLVSQYPEDALYGVSFRPGRFGVTPYFELPMATGDTPRQIDEIIIGPTSNRAASRPALSLLLSKSDTTVGRIRVSHTPLRH